MKTIKKNIVILLTIILLPLQIIFAKEWSKVLDLKGYWKFTIGDDLKWAEPNYSDEDWEVIGVPSSWEAEGFHGYNGYAWYRVKFDYPKAADNFSLHLYLGYIDDVDEVYLNGNLIGKSGSFPPDYTTAYDAERSYPIPQKYLKTDEKNLIAVRVYDSQLGGGIMRGNVGIYAYTDGMELDINLEGEWKFKIGDNTEWANENFDHSNWESIFVPGTWETRGWQNYDGIAWYRIKFFLPKNYQTDKLILVLGKIDDVDETYLNGVKIGSTGDIYNAMRYRNFGEEWNQFRGYYIPREVLKEGEENVIAVRVYDGYLNGGIYEGPIGLIKQDKYRDYWQNKKEKKNIWDLIFGD
jgi:sialate O-acetylesterase